MICTRMICTRMICTRAKLTLACVFIGSAVAGIAAQAADPVFDAMQSEMKRSMTLSLQQLAKPYFVSYTIDTGHEWSATAVMGGLLGTSSQPFRYPSMQFAVGDYKFDQTKLPWRHSHNASYALSGFPLDNDPSVIRQYLWLETDSAYKASLDAIARKRAILKGVTVTERAMADFAPAKPTTLIKDAQALDSIRRKSVERAREKKSPQSSDACPHLRASVADYTAVDSILRLSSNSEGTEIKLPQAEGQFQIRASAQGARWHDHARRRAVLYQRHHKDVPAKTISQKAAKSGADQVTKLAAAPYGRKLLQSPVLFEGGHRLHSSSPEILGNNLHILTQS